MPWEGQDKAQGICEGMFTHLYTVIFTHAPLFCSQSRSLASGQVGSLQMYPECI